MAFNLWQSRGKSSKSHKTQKESWEDSQYSSSRVSGSECLTFWQTLAFNSSKVNSSFILTGYFFSLNSTKNLRVFSFEEATQGEETLGDDGMTLAELWNESSGGMDMTKLGDEEVGGIEIEGWSVIEEVEGCASVITISVLGDSIILCWVDKSLFKGVADWTIMELGRDVLLGESIITESLEWPILIINY